MDAEHHGTERLNTAAVINRDPIKLYTILYSNALLTVRFETTTTYFLKSGSKEHIT